MARTIQEIYDALALEKDQFASLKDLSPELDNSQQLLTDVTTTSKVAEWRLWLWVVAFAMHIQESFWDIFKRDVEAIAEASKSHNLRWYQAQCLAFQYGHALVWDEATEKYTYAEVDLPSRIVTRAATVEGDNIVIAKVAKDADPLAPAELTAFEAYISEIKDAGTELVVVSDPADEFKITIDVYYDPMVLNSNGTLISDPLVFPVLDAINGFKNDLPFNAALLLNSLVDRLQTAQGVVDPHLIAVQAKSYTDNYAPVTRRYLPHAGWLNFDKDNSTINYIPAE